MSYVNLGRCAGMVLFLSVAVGRLLAKDPSLPRYRFEVGQRLTYASSSAFKYQNGTMNDSAEVQFTVVGKNGDGSHRVIITQTDTSANGRKDVQAGYADIDAAGNIRPLLDSFGYRLNPGSIVARLPATEAEAKAGWHAAGTFDAVNRYTASPESSAEKFVIDFVIDSPLDEVYGLENRGAITFDRERGVVEQIKTTSKQTYGFDGKGTGEIKLVKLTNCDDAARAKWAADAEKYFQAQKKFRDAQEGEATAKSLDEAVAELKHAATSLESEEFRQLAEGLLAQFDSYREYTLKSMEERKEVIGKAAYEFKTTDLNGQPAALADYRGKVVLLDFWYRGCGWCIRCMPQLKEFSDHYRGKPVALLGMNTDRELEDAKFVVEKLSLNYPQLKGEGINGKFNVHSFPSLILIDPQGTVRKIHAGWSPTLKQDLIQQVDSILAEKP